jgi:hypothetical protein
MDWNEFPQAEGLSPSPAGRLVRLIHGLEQGQSPAEPVPIEQGDLGESLMPDRPARSHLPSTRTQRSWLWRHPNHRTEGAVAISDQRRLARFVGRGEWDRPRWLLALTLLSMFVAGAAAVWIAWITGGALFCSVTRRLSGADIQPAADTVLAVCSFGFVLSILVCQRPRLLSTNLLLTACGLLTGILLVARDSAMSNSVESCSLFGTTTERVTEHVWYVCVIWGAALVVLLVQAGRTIRIRA